MADCCDNCREGKVCCSILDKQKHDHDHDHDHGASASVRGSNPRARRARGQISKMPMPTSVSVPTPSVTSALAAEQHAASARVASSAGLARARHNPAPSGLAVSDEQKKWLLRGAGVVAIVAGVGLGVAGWKRWKR